MSKRSFNVNITIGKFLAISVLIAIILVGCSTSVDVRNTNTEPEFEEAITEELEKEEVEELNLSFKESVDLWLNALRLEQGDLLDNIEYISNHGPKGTYRLTLNEAESDKILDFIYLLSIHPDHTASDAYELKYELRQYDKIMVEISEEMSASIEGIKDVQIGIAHPTYYNEYLSLAKNGELLIAIEDAIERSELLKALEKYENENLDQEHNTEESKAISAYEGFEPLEGTVTLPTYVKQFTFTESLEEPIPEYRDLHSGSIDISLLMEREDKLKELAEKYQKDLHGSYTVQHTNEPADGYGPNYLTIALVMQEPSERYDVSYHYDKYLYDLYSDSAESKNMDNHESLLFLREYEQALRELSTDSINVIEDIVYTVKFRNPNFPEIDTNLFSAKEGELIYGIDDHARSLYHYYK